MLFFASVVGLAVWSRLVNVKADGRRSRATDCHAVILSFFMWPRQACDAPRYVGHSVGVVTIALIVAMVQFPCPTRTLG